MPVHRTGRLAGLFERYMGEYYIIVRFAECVAGVLRYFEENSELGFRRKYAASTAYAA
jgi:hypothetical protein